MGKRALLLINTRARQGAAAAEILPAALEAEGWELETVRDDDSSKFAAVIEARADHLDQVFLAGGDGTLSCVAETLRRLRLPAAILPAGTANNVARDLGVPLDLAEACRACSRAPLVPMDLIEVGGRAFVSIAGIGLSTHIHGQVDHAAKRRWGPLAYAAKGLRILRAMPSFKIELVLSDRFAGHRAFRARALQLTVLNGRHMGGPLRLSDAATAGDGLMEVSLVRAHRWLRDLGALFTRQHHRVWTMQARTLEVRTWPAGLEVYADGEPIAKTPVRFELVPGALLMRTPVAAAKGEAA